MGFMTFRLNAVRLKGISSKDISLKRILSKIVEYNISSNIKSEMRSFKSSENIHKKEGRSYYVVSANKASVPQ